MPEYRDPEQVTLELFKSSTHRFFYAFGNDAREASISLHGTVYGFSLTAMLLLGFTSELVRLIATDSASIDEFSDIANNEFLVNIGALAVVGLAVSALLNLNVKRLARKHNVKLGV